MDNLSPVADKSDVDSTLGHKIDALQRLKFRKRQITEQLETLQKEIDLAESGLLAAMEMQDVKKSTGHLATASIVESLVPQVQDWDAFYEYIYRNKYGHLLDRRPSVSGCRELFETKGVIPGVVPFTKRTVRTTSL